MKIKYSCFSDVGKVREVNQDSIFCRQKDGVGLFAVADGMGGHTDGELASQEVADQLIQWWNVHIMECEPSDFVNLIKSLEKIIQIANSNIYQKYNNGAICGCTLVVLFIFQQSYAVISAGDSRIYKLYGINTVSQMTQDDVWEMQQSVRCQYTADEIEHHESKGKLMNAIGVFEEAGMHITTDTLKKADTFLLCSDGVYKMCTEDQIRNWMKAYRKNPDNTGLMTRVKTEIYERGALDNMSAVFVKVTKR